MSRRESLGCGRSVSIDGGIRFGCEGRRYAASLPSKLCRHASVIKGRSARIISRQRRRGSKARGSEQEDEQRFQHSSPPWAKLSFQGKRVPNCNLGAKVEQTSRHSARRPLQPRRCLPRSRHRKPRLASAYCRRPQKIHEKSDIHIGSRCCRGAVCGNMVVIIKRIGGNSFLNLRRSNAFAGVQSAHLLTGMNSPRFTASRNSRSSTPARSLRALSAC